MLHAGLHHGVEQGERPADVVGEVAGGLAHGFTDGDEGGEVDDGVALFRLIVRPARFGVGEDQLMQPSGGHVVAVPFERSSTTATS